MVLPSHLHVSQVYTRLNVSFVEAAMLQGPSHGKAAMGRQLWLFSEVHRNHSLRATDPPFGEQICGFFPKAHIAIPNWICSQTQGELVSLGTSRGRADLKVLCKQNCTAQRFDVVVPVEARTLRILVAP